MKTLKDLVSKMDTFQTTVNTNLTYLNNLIVSIENFHDEMAEDLIDELRVNRYAVTTIGEHIRNVLSISSSELPLFMEEPNHLMIECLEHIPSVLFDISDMIALCIMYMAFVEVAIQLGGDEDSVEGSIADDVYMGLDSIIEFTNSVETLSYILTEYNYNLKGGIR